MKYCKRCDRTLSVDFFTKSSGRYDGLQSYCSECMKKYRKEHYKSNKKQYTDRNKKSKDSLRAFVREAKKLPCTDCGIAYPSEPWLMEFDHLGVEEKLSEVAKLISNGSMKSLVAEIAKCELVCVLCHRRRTAKRAGWTSEETVL